MYLLEGDKETFAVELDISSDKWRNRSALWLNNTRIGDWEDEIPLFPFINSLQRIALNFEEFYDLEIEGLDGRQIYLTIHPCYFEPESFYDLSPEEQERLTKFDKYIFQWGENFDSWGLTMVYNEGLCKFLWVHTPLRGKDSFEVLNNIQCFDVNLTDVQKVYGQLTRALKPT